MFNCFNGHYTNFGSSNNLSKTLNDYLEYEVEGNMTICFKITAPTGGAITFQASFDGTTWESITLRSINNDILKSIFSGSDNVIGSIAGARKIRFLTSTGGSANGSVMGVMNMAVAIQEQIEFGNPPHRFGYTPVHKDGSYTTAQTATTIWEPASGKRFVLTDLLMNFSGSTDGEVKIFDETDSSGNYIFKATIDVSVVGGGKPIPINLKTPYISSTAGNILKITTGDDIGVSLVVHGYEI